MKKFVPLFVFLIGLNLYGQKENESWCRWRAGGDGELNIPDDGYSFFKKGNFSYYLSNDDNSLYVDLKIEDSGVQFKILQEGVIVWINTDGKSAKKTGLRFPVGAKYAKLMKISGQGSNLNSNSPLALANVIQLIGFPESSPKIIPAENNESFSGSVKYNNNGVLLYNLKLPLSDLNLKETGNQKTGFITIGIEYGAPPSAGSAVQKPSPAAGQSADMPSGGSRGGGTRGGGGRSGGGIPGGGMQGGPPPQTGESSMILWLKNITIAAQN